MNVKTEQVDQVDAKKKAGRKKKNWIIASIVGVIVLALWVPSMANNMIAKIAPDKYVALSLLEMQKLAEKEKESSIVSLPDYRKTSMDLNIKKIDGIYETFYKDIIEGLGLSFSVSNSQQGDINIDTELKKSGASLLGLNIYSTSDELGLKVPGVLDKYIMVNLDQFKSQYDASELTYFMGDIEQEEVNIFKDAITEIRNLIIGETVDTYDSLSEDYKNAFIDMAKDINVKHTGTTKTSINNKNVKANTFLITLDSGDIKPLVRDLTRATLRNKDVRKNLEAINNSSGSYYSLEDMEAEIFEVLDEVSFSDVEISCVIDQKKRMLGADLVTAVGPEGDRVRITTDYVLAGGNSIFDQLDVGMTLQSGDERIQISLEKDKSTDKKKTTQDLVFRIRENKEQLVRASLTVEHDLGKKQDNYALTSNITLDDDSKINLKLSGDLLANKNSGEVSLDANNISFSMDSYQETISLAGAGYFGIQDLKQDDISIPDQEKLNLFTLDMDHFWNIIERAESQFNQLENMF